MIQIDIKVPQTLYNRLDPARRALALFNGMQEALRYLKAKVQLGVPVDRGILRGSITTDLRGSPVSMRGIVYSGASANEYASVVERGRRPGGRMPPVAVIAAWAQRKGIQVNAFVLARSIARKGTKPVLMFRNAAQGAGPVITRIISKHLGEAA